MSPTTATLITEYNRTLDVQASAKALAQLNRTATGAPAMLSATGAAGMSNETKIMGGVLVGGILLFFLATQK